MALQYQLNLLALVKYIEQKEDGDELYLKIDGKRIFPCDKKYFKIKSDTLLVDVKIPIEVLDRWIRIELWEYNFIFSDVALGSFQMYIEKNSSSGMFSVDLQPLKDIKARYSLTWELNKSIKKDKTIKEKTIL